MLNKIIVFSLLAVLLLIAYVTNPPEDKHQKVMLEKMKPLIENIASSEEDVKMNREIENSIGMKFATIMVGEICKKIVSRDNYFLFSLTVIKINEESKIAGVGVFGFVYISSQVDKNIQEQIKQLIE